VTRRLHEGPAPAFPPRRADALLLGGTVVDLLAREEGDRAAVAALRTGPEGVLAALHGSRGGQHAAAAWRAHLVRVAEGGDARPRRRTARSRAR
jgi:hypothetical protein